MSYTNEQQRIFIEKHFLNNNIVNHIPNREQDGFNIFVPSKTPSMYDNIQRNTQPIAKSYKYLDDMMLSNDLVLFPRDLSLDYKIHLCLFSINTDLNMPFLQFMFSKNESQYTFPTFDLDMKNIQTPRVVQPSSQELTSDDDSDEDSDDDNVHINTEFLNQSVGFFHKYVKPTDDIDSKSKYRGFIEDTDNTELYVFFDCTGLHVDKDDEFKKYDLLFAIIDEINKGKINDIPINDNDIKLFKNNPFVTEINTINGEPIDTPIISYICTKNDTNNYINEYNDEENMGGSISLIPPQITHDKYGNVYVFSPNAISEDYNNIKRFALFYTDVNKDIENMEESSDETSESDDENENMEESSDENSGSDDENENTEESSDENSGSDDENENMELDLDENVVFTFKNTNDQTLYGTYSIEPFTEI